MKKVRKIEDSINKRMDKKRLLAFVDSEFSIDTNETYCSCALLVYYHNREMNIIGKVKSEGYLKFEPIHTKAKELDVDEVHIYAHFNLVDVSRIDWSPFNPNINVLELQKSSYITFEQDDIHYQIKDTMLYSNQSLEKIIKDFKIKDNSKDFLRDLAKKHGLISAEDDKSDARLFISQLWQLDKEGVMEYCLMDCYATFEFIKILDEMSRNITREECGIEFSIIPFVTIGAFNERYQYLKAKKRGDKTFMDVNSEMDINILVHTLNFIEMTYKGGGIIYNDFVGKIDFTKGLYGWQFDVTSLYPIAGMLIPDISLRLKDWKSIEEMSDVTMHEVKERVEELRKMGIIEAFIHICGEMPTSTWHPILTKANIKGLKFEGEGDEYEVEDNSTLLSLKSFNSYVSLRELESILKWLESKGVDLWSVRVHLFEGKGVRVQGKNV